MKKTLGWMALVVMAAAASASPALAAERRDVNRGNERVAYTQQVRGQDRNWDQDRTWDHDRDWNRDRDRDHVQYRDRDHDRRDVRPVYVPVDNCR